MSRRGLAHPVGYFGTCHAGRIDIDRMREFLGGNEPGLIEFGLHPGSAPAADLADSVADGWTDPLAGHRPQELALLASDGLANLLASRPIRLARLSELAATRIVSAAA
jgi:hypothetical protein